MEKAKVNLQTISRSIQVLRCFDNDADLGITDIAKRLGLAKSTVFGIVSTLEYNGFLEQDSRTGRYRLGTELFRLGTKVKADLLSLCKPYMEKLVAAYRETVHLVIPDQCSILYIHKIESPHSMRICSKVGERQPLYCTGVGKAILAYLGESERKAIMDKMNFVQMTPFTIGDMDFLNKELAGIKAKGFAVDREELEVGLICVAAPVFDSFDKPVAAISVAGPASRMTDRVIADIAGTLTAFTRELSGKLGSMQGACR
jgi:IclR family KDG regulon transcriptional repressor